MWPGLHVVWNDLMGITGGGCEGCEMGLMRLSTVSRKEQSALEHISVTNHKVSLSLIILRELNQVKF